LSYKNIEVIDNEKIFLFMAAFVITLCAISAPEAPAVPAAAAVRRVIFDSKQEKSGIGGMQWKNIFFAFTRPNYLTPKIIEGGEQNEGKSKVCGSGVVVGGFFGSVRIIRVRRLSGVSCVRLGT
jgi:hypothetical protein